MTRVDFHERVNPSLQDLVNGDMEYFEKIINDNKLVVYSTVFSIIKDKHAADDIVQETFIYAYWHYHTLRDQAKLRSWLCAIAKNKAYDYAKQVNRIIAIGQIGDRAPDITPEEQYVAEERYHYINERIHSLPQKLREVILLYYFANNSIKEISDLLAIPQGTVKSRLNAGRRKLKKELLELMVEKGEIIKNEDIFVKIKKEIEKARRAIEEGNTLQASQICDPLFAQVGNPNELTLEQLKVVDQLYDTKIDSVYYVDYKETLDLFKKKVEIAELSNDAALIVNTYIYYAGFLSNMKHERAAMEYYLKALDKAKTSGDINLISKSSYWCGIEEYRHNTPERGLRYFKEVISHKDKLLNDETSAKTYTLAFSAAKALETSAKSGDIHNLSDFISSCATLYETDQGLVLRDMPGFSKCRRYCSSIIGLISKIEPFLSDYLHVGYTFEKNTLSYSHVPVRSRFEVLSLNEHVSVPCGTFDDCLHTRYQNYVADTNEINQITNGTTDIWYAPNVGVVKVTFQPLKGDPNHYELKEYHVTPSSGGLVKTYLPLSVGNWWSYEYFDVNGKPQSLNTIYENKSEVLFQLGNYTYIAHSGWGYKKS